MPATVFTPERARNILTNQYFSLSGYLPRIPSVVYKVLSVIITSSSSSYPDVNGSVEQVNHTIAQTLVLVVNQYEYGWDA